MLNLLSFRTEYVERSGKKNKESSSQLCWNLLENSISHSVQKVLWMLNESNHITMAIFIHNLVWDLSGGHRLPFLLSHWEMQPRINAFDFTHLTCITFEYSWDMCKGLSIYQTICVGLLYWIKPLEICAEFLLNMKGFEGEHSRHISNRLHWCDSSFRTWFWQHFFPIFCAHSFGRFSIRVYELPRKFNWIVLIPFHYTYPWLGLEWWTIVFTWTITRFLQ